MARYSPDDSLGFLIRKAQTALHNRLFQNFKAAGLDVTPDQWGVLVRLMAKDGIPQSELALGSDRNDSSTTRILDTLSKKGLVERRAHDTDRRVNLIYLTEKGLDMQKKLLASVGQTTREATHQIPEPDVTQFKRVLWSIIENLS